MGYKSPIDIIYGDIQIEVEDNVVKAIQGYRINIDKDELIKVLNYDREQYNKGYKDGVNDVLNKIRTEIETLYDSTDTESHNAYESAYEQGKERAYEFAIDIIDKYKESDTE